jgi:radical SAM protein with 4Fe4S-binding SPASM domain
MNEQNDRPWQKSVSLGNIFEKSAREIWNGEKYVNMCKSIRENKSCKECKRCFLFK